MNNLKSFDGIINREINIIAYFVTRGRHFVFFTNSL